MRKNDVVAVLSCSVLAMGWDRILLNSLFTL